jgi:pSer/pThr/pTyr-binding forkhead associated (FHA) protein
MHAIRPNVQVALSLNGRHLRHFAFTQPTILIGREPSADIFLDNPGVSRNHARLELTGDGWQLLDLGSANGTYLEGERVDRAILREESQVQVGKFTLKIAAAVVPAGARPPSAYVPADMLERTTVLTRGQLAVVMSAAREPSEQVAEPRAGGAEDLQPRVVEFPGVAEEHARTGILNPALVWGICVVMALIVGFLLGRR